jgi:hypothetical protein
VSHDLRTKGCSTAQEQQESTASQQKNKAVSEGLLKMLYFQDIRAKPLRAHTWALMFAVAIPTEGFTAIPGMGKCTGRPAMNLTMTVVANPTLFN